MIKIFLIKGTKIELLNMQLEEVDKNMSQPLDEGMLLISRGVQDEIGLKEHLEQHYKKILGRCSISPTRCFAASCTAEKSG